MADKKSKLTLVKLNKADLAKGRHVLIVESSESRRAVSLNVNVFSIGRHPNNDLVVSDVLASRHHATVAWMRYSEGTSRTDYSYWIIDGKGKRKRSRNGIYVNGNKKSLHRLVSGDIIKIGNDIKISYSYIAYSTDNSQFLNYCGGERAEYKPIFTDKKSYKDTVVIENINANHDIPEDSSIIENTIVNEQLGDDSMIIEETIIKE
ncbi:MAG: FHA domain-containing protein [Cyanobacteria bacterium P01_G01_bin.67]